MPVLAFFLTSLAAGADHWTAFGDFAEANLPGSPWTLGWADASGMRPYPIVEVNVYGADTWHRGDWDPNVARSGTGADLAGDGFVYPGSEWVHVHPGPAGERSVVRWSAPADGSWRVTACVQPLRTSYQPTTSHASVSVAGEEVLSADVVGFRGTVAATCVDVTRTLVAGDVIEVSVGDGGNGYLWDSTGVSATVSRVGSGPLDAECPPDADWLHHGEYVACVAHAAADAVDAGLLTRMEANSLVVAAARSAVGR